MLLEIINTPAIRTSKNITTAVTISVCPIVVSIRLSRSEKSPCLSASLDCSIRAPISAMLKIAVTINTAKIMQSSVMRFCRRWTFAEMGIKLK